MVKFLYDENSEETIFDQGKEELKVSFNFKLKRLFFRKAKNESQFIMPVYHTKVLAIPKVD